MTCAWKIPGLPLVLGALIIGCATSSQQSQVEQQENFQNESSDEEAGDDAENLNEADNPNAGKNSQVNDQGNDVGAQNSENKNNAGDDEFDLAAENSGNLPYIDDNALAPDGDLPANANLGANDNFANSDMFGNGNVVNNTGDALSEDPPAENSLPIQNNLTQNTLTANQGIINPVANGGAQGQAIANNVLPPAPLNAGAAPILEMTQDTSKSTLRDEFRYRQPDIDPDYAQLRWVGYHFDKDQKKLKIEIVTHGDPTFEVLQENNRAGQPELVVRFYETDLKDKMARPLDASEFRSPVAYVRMRPNDDEHYVDVVMTLRENVRPKLFAKNGDVRLTFDIPEYYFGNSSQDVAQKIGSAEKLSVADLFPDIEEDSDAPRRAAFVPDPAAKAFEGAPADEGTSIEPTVAPAVEPGQLPASFEDEGANSPDEIAPQAPENETINFEGRIEDQRDDALAAFHIERFVLAAVAQDNLEENEETGNLEDENLEDEENANNSANQEANSQQKDQPANQGANNGPINNNAANFVNDQPPKNAPVNGNAVPLNNGAPINGGQGNNALINNAPLDNGAVGNAPLNNGSGNIPLNNVAPLNNGSNALLNNVPVNVEPEPLPEAPAPAPDVTGTDTEGAPTAMAGGRPLSIEFHRAPLHVVLKTFGEESGNNFIYPADVATTEITIRLRQVPWDEALKAILETYGLGMVQVGQNVVRIDRLAKMNEYLKDLNTVRQYREQLESTKILVMRLSHGTAKDIVAQMADLLKTDIEKDPRIKITADARTNSVVAEAATATLSKIKNVLERLDLETPQVRIASRIVEVSKSATNFFGILWSNTFNFDPGRGLGLGSLPFPNSVNSDFTVDPGVSGQSTSGNLTMRFGSLNRFIDLDLLLKMEERKGTTNILQNNNVLVLDRERASILAGSSQFFRPAAGGNVISQGGVGGGAAAQGNGLAEVTFNLSLDVVPQVTAAGNINMRLIITSDTPGDPTGEQLATKNTRRLETVMTRRNGETAVIGGIYDTKRTKTVVGVPYLSDIPILGLLFKSTLASDTQTELLIMVTPTLVGLADNADASYQDGFASGAPGGEGTDQAGDSEDNLEDEGISNLQSNNAENGGTNNGGELNNGGGGNLNAGGNTTDVSNGGNGNGATANNNFGAGADEANF